jgi:type III restriction enzyme
VKRQEQRHVYALPERAALEIEFPRVEGYQQAIRNRIAVDWDAVPRLKIDPLAIPNEVLMKASIVLNKGRPSLQGPGKLEGLTLARWRKEVRLQERVFDMAQALTRQYVAQDTCEAPPHVLFPQLLRVVQQFVTERVDAADPDQRLDVFLAPYYGWAVERLAESIRPDATQGEAPEVPKYEKNRPSGSTAEVDFWTTKPVRETAKSHLNYVVADTKQWEQAAAYYLEASDRVVAYVKDQGLGFAIPYLHDGEGHDYIPDFIVRLDNGVRLVLETKGHDPLEEVKAAAARRWCDAVNADGSFGEWRYAVAHEMPEIPNLLERSAAAT